MQALQNQSSKAVTLAIKSIDDVCAVVVTYNSAHCIPALAESLAHLKNIVFVDNGSADNTLAIAKNLFPRAHNIALPANVGFGSANNVGLRYIAAHNLASFALLINPDCSLDVANLEQLLNTANQYPEAALVAPVLTQNGKVQHTYRMAHSENDYKPKINQCDGVVCVGFQTGACWLLRINAALAVNGFDERIFLYYEDDDLCLRLSKAGYSLLVDPSARAEHASRGSVKMKSSFRAEYIRGYHHTRAKLYFSAKWQRKQSFFAGRWGLLLITACLLVPARALTLNQRYLGRACGRLIALLHKPIKIDRNMK